MSSAMFCLGRRIPTSNVEHRLIGGYQGLDSRHDRLVDASKKIILGVGFDKHLPVLR
jgi:hypothetical protein